MNAKIENIALVRRPSILKIEWLKRLGSKVMGQITGLLNAMLCGSRLVRRVGPGLRPLERHEFESHELRIEKFRGRPF